MLTMDRTSSSMILMNIPSGSSGSRSVSPMTPSLSPARELRGARLFRAISRKLGRRYRDDMHHHYTNEEDSRSSSTDSCSSISAGGSRSSRSRKCVTACSSESSSGFRSVSPHRISTSSSSSDAGSDTQTVRHRNHRSISTATIRKVFQSLSINNHRSQSCCDSSEKKKKSSKKTTPKRILRPPVTYTYVRGLSGLPTQRIANPKVYVTQSSGCGCSVQYMAALHR